MQREQTLQDNFLSKVRQSRQGVTMFLMDGFQLRGGVTAFDSFTVVLDSDGKQQLIYKHAISTVVPQRPLALEPEGAAARRTDEDKLCRGAISSFG